MNRHRKQLEVVLNPEAKPRGEASPSDNKKVIAVKEEQQEWSSSVDQEDPEPLRIKEEQEELRISQEGEHFPFTPVPVKSEDDEEKPQSSQLHQTQADGEDCGRPEPVPGDSSEPETDDSDFWKETREPQSGLNFLKNNDVPVSAGEKPYSCSECSKGFGLRGDLKKHMRTHTGEKPFSCSVCQKSFTQSGSLQSHMKIHTGEKPFGCSECGKRFGRKDYLRTHQTTHTGEKPFSCLVCQKSFTVIGSLQRHMRIHTVDKQHSCSICGERFNRYNQLRVHLYICHQTQTELMKQESDGENCVGPEPARNSSADTDGDPSEAETDDSDDWTETGEPRSKLDMEPFSCSECHEPSEDPLLTHRKYHPGEKPFHCSVCSADFSDSEALVQHMRVHTIQTQFSCPICSQEFAWRRYLTKHMEVHSKDRIYSRRYFNRTFARRRQVKRHKCVDCQLSQLRQTEENKEAEPPSSSSTRQIKTEDDGDDCGGQEPTRNLDTDDSVDSVDSDFWKDTKERLSSLKSLKTDEAPISDERRRTDKKTLSCSECGKRSDKRSPRTRAEEKPFSCSVCGKTFSKRTNVTQHMRIHTGEKRFSCGVCHKRFAWRLQIKKHKCIGRQSSQIQQRRTKQLKTAPESVKNSRPHDQRPETDHQNGVSSKIKVEFDDGWTEAREPQSGLNPPKNDKLPVRDLARRTGEKPFTCPECGKGFGSKGSLKIHIRTHTGEKPFVCSVCGKGFHRKDNLVQHMRSHTEEKPFSCPFCQKSFTQSGNLQTHIRVHTGEKRYSCSICNQRFTWLYQLRNHQCVEGQKSLRQKGGLTKHLGVHRGGK